MRSTIEFVAKATSVKPGRSAPKPGAASTTRRATSTDRNAAKLTESAEAEARRVRAAAAAEGARTREEAEEHARRLILDARATADGVRAEGMEVVSNLRQISDTLRELSERVLRDVEAIHARMVGELERAAPGDAVTEEPAATAPLAEPAARDQLDVPDFVARG
jgi:cell division septum initiation protein DivIVA